MITIAAGQWPSGVPDRDSQEASLSASCKVRINLFTLQCTLMVRWIHALSKQEGIAVNCSKTVFARQLIKLKAW